ncbi:DEAD/DEAH box helicase [Devosia sp. FJ2-5-3]|uniref:DEAD/DEAH box helicase n=1 Tax=Devosia sp. FJ2-5-3 TaxID=2976680 RepID=UPI0023D88329|nr:DEAD/DEAH box helicase [Devosia sp. FJ2-5-3]WEJ57420.1 DEAD/DEAH box helicase [Devosia sp. FJ2-5-3]
MSLPDSILPAIAGALAAKGYANLTAVQSAVIEDETAGRDLLVSAQTGSGKTVAFGMAIAPTILGDADTLPDAEVPLALVIAPTRELALQVQRELEWLYANLDARIVASVGGMDARTERRALERGAHIVVGTPGRLRDHITRGALDMSALRAVVLDEADEMLDLGFREDLEFILAAAPEDRRTLLFSATVPRPIVQLAKTFQRDALRISATSSEEQHADIDYRLMLVPAAERENAVINTLLWFDSANTIVFASTREGVKHLSARLHNRGFDVVTLSGELSQAERTSALQSMRDGRARICVATDVAARGIDLPNLDLVIHADLPTNADTLLHRSGRTGRAGRKGTSVIIAGAHRRGVAQRILRTAKLDVSLMTPPLASEIEEKYKEAILSSETIKAPENGDEAQLVSQLLERHTPEAIAAAYLRQQLAARPIPEDVTAQEAGAALDTRAPRTRERFEGGTWFRVNVGRKQRAEPRWLLPMLCKAGKTTKGDIGSIRIFDTESLFEIAADKADAYARTIAKNGSGEKGITISPVEGDMPVAERSERPKSKRPDFDSAPRGERPERKTWSKDGDDASKRRPAAAKDKPAFKSDKPYKEKTFSKDKGKPTWSKDGDKPRAPKRKPANG